MPLDARLNRMSCNKLHATVLNMVRKMNKNLKNLICASFILSVFFPFYSISSDLTDKKENFVNCTSDPPNNHKCEMQYYGKKSVLRVKYDVCPGFDINIDNDIVEVFCSPPRDYSNYSYYKYINGHLLFFKYDSAFGGNDNLVDELSFQIDSPYLISLKKDFYDDMKNNTIPHIGEVKSKSFLFDENRNKSKMYLIKGDKVLILSSKIDGNNQEWYRIFYSGKKDIDMWIKADAVYLN